MRTEKDLVYQELLVLRCQRGGEEEQGKKTAHDVEGCGDYCSRFPSYQMPKCSRRCK